MARVAGLGRSGTGKSWYAGYLMERVIPDFDCAIVLDLEGEEKAFCHKTDEYKPILKSLYLDKAMLEEIDLYEEIKKNRKVRIEPDSLTSSEQRELFDNLAKIAMRLGRDGNSVYVACDEGHVVAPNNAIPEGTERMVTGGRKKGVEWQLTTQRPQKIDETPLTQADRLIMFGISGNNDLQKLRDAEVPVSVVDEVGNLDEREAIVYNVNSGDYKRINTNEMERTRPHLADDDGVIDDHMPV